MRPLAWLALLLAAAPACSEGGDETRDYPAHCYNEKRDADESYRDCGGSCGPCAPGEGCVREEDCASGVCNRGFCLIASCNDATLNQDETDIDCGGGCEPCEGGETCVAPADCASLVCTKGLCAATSCGDGELSGDETDVDCGGRCDACAPGQGCVAPSDCESGLCVGELCTAPTCVDNLRNGGETDIDCGGPDCDGCADAQKCDADDDCASGDCAFERCISCADGLQNGTETGRDCGGDCGPCRAGEGCGGSDDCQSLVCEDDVCQPATCSDDVKNGDETGEDCGGNCPPCAGGEGCLVAEDCASFICDEGTCTTSSCEDDVRNGGESDVDCGGTTACPRCRDFRGCTINEDCASNVCNADDLCGAQSCSADWFDAATAYRACRYTPAVLGCPDLSAAPSTGLVSYDSFVTLPLGFTFPFFGAGYTEATVQTHGAITFDAAYLTKNNSIAAILTPPDDVIAAFWDDLDAEFAGASVRYQAAGTAPNRTFAVRWQIGSNAAMATELAEFTVVLHESGLIRACYPDTIFGNTNVDEGRSATVALFHGGTPFRVYNQTSAVDSGIEIVWTAP